MVKGIGNDIIEIDRIALAMRRHGQKFLDKIFTKNEQAYCLKHNQPERHFAGRFAAKEAIVKALGTGLQGVDWLDIEIVNNAAGKPCVTLSPTLQHQYADSVLHISISHCRTFATAVAILEPV